MAPCREALIYAAGLGTRLRPLTDRLPKALVEVAGVPMLERVARRLSAAGVERLVVNVHPFAEAIQAFVRERDGFGMEVVLSHERERPLETGGGLLAARQHFAREGPLLVHNVDVLTDLDLVALLDAHQDGGALATLAVAARPSSRRLLFDAEGLLGREDDARGIAQRVRPERGAVKGLAFSGVHVLDRALLARIEERGVFSIVETWLRLAGEGATILPHRADGCRWIDVGRPADLQRARRLFAGGRAE